MFVCDSMSVLLGMYNVQFHGIENQKGQLNTISCVTGKWCKGH